MVPRTASLLVSTALLAGCATFGPPSQDAWVGRSVDDLVVAWGAPTQEHPLQDGGRVLTWYRDMGDTSLTAGGITSSTHHSCTTTFRVSRNGEVTHWSSIGCT
jgi:hypothetical protein